ncbi:MAG: hypothetical protein IOC49_03890 [Methylobacterium sp.]|nr:hypothetical protein [Methylobacterium sp.]
MVSGSREENATRQTKKHFQAEWFPVRVKKMRSRKKRAFSSGVVSGSREENAIKKKESIFKRSMPLAKAGVVSGSRE